MQTTIYHYLGTVWYLLLNNNFQYLNNNDISDTYFYNTQTRIFTTLKTEQQYLNIPTKHALVSPKKKKTNHLPLFRVFT